MEEATPETQSNGNMMYYVVGALVVVAIAGGIYFLRPKQATSPQTTTPVAEGLLESLPPRPTGPIAGLACEQQYYNPVVGFPQYFLSAEGVDSTGTKTVNCKFTVSVGGNTVATETKPATLTPAPERNGQLFSCTTSKLELTKSVPTKVDVQVTNDANVVIDCSRVFQFP